MIREAIKKATGNVMEFGARARAELDVKGARAEVATAADNLEAAKATLDAAKRAVTAATERETIRARLVDVQVEEQLALNAETALVTAQKRLAEAAAAADQSRRRATFDRAAKRAAEAKTAFADKYAPAMKELLDVLAVAAAAEKAITEANANLPPGESPFAAFGFEGAAPKILQLVACDARGRTLWTGDQFAADR
jgi:hypothetical protein